MDGIVNRENEHCFEIPGGAGMMVPLKTGGFKLQVRLQLPEDSRRVRI
jgi:hypothetical protein